MRVFTIPEDAPSPERLTTLISYENEGEFHQIWEMDRLISQARTYVSRVRSAIALADLSFDYEPASNSGDLLAPAIVSQWSVIAAHSCISSIFAFVDILDGIDVHVGKAAILDGTGFKSSSKKAREAVAKKFPKWSQLRHATQHSGTISVEFEKNAHTAALTKGWLTKSKGTRALMSDNFEDRVFQTVRRGENLKFPVTWESYFNLVEAYNALLKGMPPTAD